MSSEICHFYKGRHVFITGATGFMGKVLVEKLLRSCPDIDTLYLLIRPKKGQTVQERLNEYKLHKIFCHICDDTWLRVQAVEGDVAEIDLGLNTESRTLLTQHVSVIIHAAATVRFDEPMRSAILLNTRGTREIINLGRQTINLKALVHVSTAYSNPLESVIEEKVYTPPANPHKMIKLVEILEDDNLNLITNRLLQGYPNTYVFSKSLAESLMNEVSTELPVAIFRPSIVCPALREPFPGWADSKLGPMGMLVGAGSGVIRSAYGYGDIVCDLLPVDFGINALLAVAWRCANPLENYKGRCMVYNCTTSSEAPVTMNKFLQLGRRVYARYPHEKAFWFPGGGIQETRWMYFIMFFLTQLLPAILFDTAMLIVRRDTWLLRLQRRIYSNTKTFQFFLLHEWKFLNKNTRELLQSMSSEDRVIFDFDATQIEYENYIDVWTLGVRRHMMGQDDSTIESARSNYNRLYWLHMALQLSLVWLFLYSITCLTLQNVTCLKYLK